MFAEDTAIFDPDVFTQFIRAQTREDGPDLGAKLNELFDWLNDSRVDAVTDEDDQFHGFRYVNGGLFEKPLRFARFDREMRDKLLFCCEFLWERISPAVFGSLFQGVLLPDARRQQGAHYTIEWREIVCGAALAFGIFRPGATLLLAGILIGFLIALVTAWARGLDIHCGCFVHSSGKSHLWASVLLDVALLGAVCLISKPPPEPKAAAGLSSISRTLG